MLSRRIFWVFTSVFAMALAFFTPASLLAQATELAISYDEGLVRFDYDQYPWGSMAGSYSAEGVVWNDDLTFPNGALEGSGGVMEVRAVNDSFSVIAMSAVINDNGTIDAAIVHLTYGGEPVPGVFNVELGVMEAGFVYLDDTTNLTFPEDDNFEAWFNGVEAAGKYVGMSGSIVVNQVDVHRFEGTFSGRMVNPSNFVMLDITAGVFDVTNNAVAAAGPMIPLATMKAYPNPFNPQTTIFLDVPQAGPALVRVFNIRGQCVRQLASGAFSEGGHSWIWDGKSDSGVRQAGGLYLAKAEGRGWSVNRKLVYVP